MISVSSNNAAVCSRLEVNAFCSPWISPCLFLYYYGESRIPLRGLKFRHFVRNFWPCGLGVVYSNLVLSTANGVMFCEIYLQGLRPTMTSPWSTIYLLIYLLYFKFFLTDPWRPILDPSFPVNSNFCSLTLFFFFNHWSNHLFPSNQRFQGI